MGKSNKVVDGSSVHHNPFELSTEQLNDLMESSSYQILSSEPYNGVTKIAEALQTNIKLGLDMNRPNDIEYRVKLYGENKYPVPPPSNPIIMFIQNLNDPMLIILIVAAIVSIILGLAVPDSKSERPYAWIEGFVILLAVLLVDCVTTGNDLSKESKFRSLNKEAKKILVSTVRNGQNTEVLIDDILVGEIVVLKTGDYQQTNIVKLYIDIIE
jgi:magnesium-transporting ATPase (P-type)